MDGTAGLEDSEMPTEIIPEINMASTAQDLSGYFLPPERTLTFRNWGIVFKDCNVVFVCLFVFGKALTHSWQVFHQPSKCCHVLPSRGLPVLRRNLGVAFTDAIFNSVSS